MIFVYSSKVEHCAKLEMVFQKMDEAIGQLNLEKCKLAHSKVLLLGHLVLENGIEVDLGKWRVFYFEILLRWPRSWLALFKN